MYYWAKLAEKRNARLALNTLSIHALASQGTGRAIKEEIKKLKRAAR